MQEWYAVLQCSTTRRDECWRVAVARGRCQRRAEQRQDQTLDRREQLLAHLRACAIAAIRSEGSESFRKFQEGSGRFRKIQEVSGRFRKVQEGSGSFGVDRSAGRGGCRLTPAVSFLSSSGSCRQASKRKWPNRRAKTEKDAPCSGQRQTRHWRTPAARVSGCKQTNKQTNKQTRLGVQLNARKEAHQEPSVATCCIVLAHVATCCIVSAHVATCCTVLAHGVQCRNMLHGMRQR